MNVDEVLAKMDALDTNEEEIQYIIDENLRVISIPPLGVVLGVEGDKDVNSAKFKMVRYYKGIDLSKFDIRINFANANGDLSYYTVKNLTVTDDTLTFEWLVGYLATKYKGTVRFVVRMITTDASTGEVQQAFDTTVGEARSLEGLLVDTPTDEKVYDIVAQLKADLTDHVNNLIETIPDDYSELTQKVEDNTSGISELKEDKLDKPNNPVVGQFLRVKSISDTGEIVLETMAGGVGGGLPNGGTVGQVLAKKSDADGDTEWADMESEEVTADNITQALGYTPRKAWYVNVTPGNPITADKTAAEIWKAYQDGYSVFAKVVVDDLYPFTLPLVLPMGAETFGFATVGQMSEDSAPMTVCLACYADVWSFYTCQLAASSQIPTALKNPNALTVKIGSTTVTYDGSVAETVEIADGTEVGY